MANSKAISVRIPDELLEKIDRLAEEKYKSHKGTPNRSLVVLDAIAAYFEIFSTNVSRETAVSDSVSTADFDELRREVSELKTTVRDLLDKTLAVSDNASDAEEKLPEQNQLSIITVSDSVEELTGKELAKRLSVNPSEISNRKSSLSLDEFVEWTRSLPANVDKVGWTYKQKEKGKGVIYYQLNG